MHFGLYWDKRFNPYCPACKTPLTGYGHYNNFGYGFKCVKCDNQLIQLNDKTGSNISLEKAINQLKAQQTAEL